MEMNLVVRSLIIRKSRVEKGRRVHLGWGSRRIEQVVRRVDSIVWFLEYWV